METCLYRHHSGTIGNAVRRNAYQARQRNRLGRAGFASRCKLPRRPDYERLVIVSTALSGTVLAEAGRAPRQRETGPQDIDRSPGSIPYSWTPANTPSGPKVALLEDLGLEGGSLQSVGHRGRHLVARLPASPLFPVLVDHLWLRDRFEGRDRATQGERLGIVGRSSVYH